LAVLGIKFVGWINPEPSVRLLTDIDGLVQLTSVDDISQYSNTKVLIPETTFDSELFVIGVYTKENPAFQKGAVSLVFVKDNWRTFEIDYEPNKSINDELEHLYETEQVEKIFLNKNTKAYFSDLRALQSCVQPKQDLPGLCRISKQLVFEFNNVLITISADANQVTQGEMVLIAKSIITSL